MPYSAYLAAIVANYRKAPPMTWHVALVVAAGYLALAAAIDSDHHLAFRLVVLAAGGALLVVPIRHWTASSDNTAGAAIVQPTPVTATLVYGQRVVIPPTTTTTTTTTTATTIPPPTDWELCNINDWQIGPAQASCLLRHDRDTELWVDHRNNIWVSDCTTCRRWR